MIVIRRYKYLKVGNLTSIYLMWAGVGRLVIETMRTDSLMLGSFKIAQIVSLVMLIFGIILFIVTSRGTRFENLYNDMQNFKENS